MAINLSKELFHTSAISDSKRQPTCSNASCDIIKTNFLYWMGCYKGFSPLPLCSSFKDLFTPEPFLHNKVIRTCSIAIKYQHFLWLCFFMSSVPTPKFY